MSTGNYLREFADDIEVHGLQLESGDFHICTTVNPYTPKRLRELADMLDQQTTADSILRRGAQRYIEARNWNFRDWQQMALDYLGESHD